jgi:tRNA-intron endonuclease
MAKVKAELVENRIVVWDIQASREIFKGSFYGKPLGIPKPKGADFDAPLILDLIEGYYLAKEGRITIHDAKTGEKAKDKEVEKKCRSEYINFDEKYLVYKELREAGYVVTPGIKFGCDFAIYEHGPGIDHAPYLVQVLLPDQSLTATAIVLAGRLATTVRKQFVIAVPNVAKKVDFLSFDWWRA